MHKQILLFLTLSAIHTSVLSDTGDQYSFLRIGSMSVNESNVSTLTAAGFTYGLGMTQRLSFELDAHLTTGGGEYKTNNTSGSYEVAAAGVSLVHRESFSRDFYIKIKAGAMFEQIDIYNSVSQTNSRSTGVHASGGLGAGIALSIGSLKSIIELEALQIEKNISLYNLGLNISF